MSGNIRSMIITALALLFWGQLALAQHVDSNDDAETTKTPSPGTIIIERESDCG